MKLKEFFSKRGEQGKFKDNEAFTKFLETIKDDAEVPDEIDKLVEQNFMTAERARADKDILAKSRFEVYSIVDERIKGILPAIEKLDKALVIDIDAEPDTLKKVTKLGGVLTKIADKAKTFGTEETEKVKELEKQKSDLLERIAKQEEEHPKLIEKLTKEFSDKEKDITLNYALKQRLGKIEYGDEHKPIREAIDEVVLTKLKTGNHLHMNESGNIELSTLENGVPKPKFIEGTNTQLTFDKALEDLVKPYVKKNNVDTGKNGKQEPPKHTPKSTPEGKPTLKEIQMQRASQGV